MIIHESSIRPFEPHGIPTLRRVGPYNDLLQNVYDNLNSIYKLIRDLELDDDSGWAKETIEGAAKEAGAISALCNKQPLKGKAEPTYLVYFYLQDGPYERMHMMLLHEKS